MFLVIHSYPTVQAVRVNAGRYITANQFGNQSINQYRSMYKYQSSVKVSIMGDTLLQTSKAINKSLT